MLLEAMGTCDEDLRVGIITNGGIKRRALILAQLTKAHVINAELSLDEYHDPIHPDVVKAFQKIGQSEWGSGFMAVRDTSNNGQREPLPHGRALDLLGYDEDDHPNEDGADCACPDWKIAPDGTVYQCGCADSPAIGHVSTGIDSPLGGECCHSAEFVSACTEENSEYEHLLY
jgi:hypothetical protein